jgi:L-ascorbate peroxidase
VISFCSIFIVSQDEEAFFRDYAASHKKLSELGFTQGSSGFKVKDTTVLEQSAAGVAVAAAVVILSYFYEVRKKMK